MAKIVNPTNKTPIAIAFSDLHLEIWKQHNEGNRRLENAKDVLTNIINSNPKVLKDKGFGISVTDLAETSVKLGVNVWAKSSDYGSLKAELLEEIKIKFDEVGITIPYSKNVYQQIKN